MKIKKMLKIEYKDCFSEEIDKIIDMEFNNLL